MYKTLIKTFNYVKKILGLTKTGDSFPYFDDSDNRF